METIDIIRGRRVNPDTGDWEGEDGVPIRLVVLWIAPASSSDVDAEGRQGFRDALTIYAPGPGRSMMWGPQPAIEDGDEFDIRGERYVLQGAVGQWRHPFVPGVLDGVQFTLKTGEG